MITLKQAVEGLYPFPLCPVDDAEHHNMVVTALSVRRRNLEGAFRVAEPHWRYLFASEAKPMTMWLRVKRAVRRVLRWIGGGARG